MAATITPPSSVPIMTVSCSAVRISEFARGSSSDRIEVRQARVGGRPREPGGDPGHERKRDELPRPGGEDEQHEHAEPDDVRRDEQQLAREPVDERPEQKPDRDRRQEVGDQERGHPDARVIGAVARRRG